MTTPITDEELPAIEEADRILRTGGGDVTHGAVVARAVPRMIARIRADAATIADLRRQVEQRDAQVKILRDAMHATEIQMRDVAAFLDALDDNPAPAWLDAPDGDGYWWVRGRTYDRIVSVSLMATDPPRWRATGDDEDWEAGAKNGYQWQRVAAPREDV